MTTKALLLCILAMACVVDVRSVSGEVVKRLEFSSPDKRWQVVAEWEPNHHGYLFELHDLSNGKTYFKQKAVGDHEILPYRFNANWSPGGRYVAINLHYGRICQGVVVIDVSGKEPAECPLHLVEKALIPPELALIMVATEWVNETDLAFEAYLPYTLPRKSGDIDSCSLIVRMDRTKPTVIKKVEHRE